MTLARITTPIIDLIFPPRCPVCSEATDGDEQLCLACWQTIAFVTDPSCPLCALPVHEHVGAEPSGAVRCGTCAAHAPPQQGLSAAAYYDSAARDLAISFKHSGRPGLARMMARIMQPRIAHLADDQTEWLVIPVPLHRWRIWRRGFNQAALLAGELARINQWPLLVDGLARPRATPRLEGLSRQQRGSIMADAITVTPPHHRAISGASVLLVDDVVTTGATSAACISALKQAGAVRVHIACWARVPLAR